MRSMIAKLAILLALPLMLLTACGGSLSGEIRAALSSEKAKAAKLKTLGTVYVRSCVETIKSDPEVSKALETNPFVILQLIQYCSRLAEQNGDQLTGKEQAAALGCVQPSLNNDGLPQTSEQEKALVAKCEETAGAALGRKKAPKPEASPSAAPSATPSAEPSASPSPSGK